MVQATLVVEAADPSVSFDLLVRSLLMLKGPSKTVQEHVQRAIS